MRRYPMIIVLLLSFTMPLQVAAEALLASLPCPDMASMDHAEMDMEHTEANMKSPAGAMTEMNAPMSMKSMDCCDGQNELSVSDNHCGFMKTCQMCKTGNHFTSYLLGSFSFARIPSEDFTFAVPLILPFSSADVWRPPTRS